MTWAQVATRAATAAGDKPRITLFRALASAPGSGALTVDFGGTTQLHCAWSVVEFDGVDTTGTNGAGAIVQSLGADGSSTSAIVTLAAFAAVENATYGAVASRQGATGLTAGTGFTLIHDERATGESLHVGTEWRADNDTTVDFTTADTPWAIIGVEIKASVDQIVEIGKALEADRALAVAVGIDQTVDVGKALEADRALPVSGEYTVDVGTARETDRALPVSADYTVDVGKATEHERALLLTIERAGFPDVPLDALIELAFGADLAADPSTWTWTAISEPPAGSTEPRLETQSPLSIRRGRADESSAHQPASISFVLRNHDGALTPDNPLSPYWPNVDVGTPCRITLRGLPIVGNPESVRLVGTVDSWEPYWPHQAGGKVRADGAVVSNAYVAVTANGILRRLGQGAKPLLSALRRQLAATI